MIAATQELVYNRTGQTLVLRHEYARPSAVVSLEVRPVYADDTQDAESATTGSGSVDTSPNTTLSAAAGPTESNPTAITVSSGTGGTLGLRVRITEDGTGVYEDAEVASVNGTAWTLRHPLKNAYSSGSTVQTTACSWTINSTWIADEANVITSPDGSPAWRATWVVTIGGTNLTFDRYFDVVRYVARHNVSPLDVANAHRWWLDALPPDHQVDQGRGLIDAAFRSVKRELRGDAKSAHRIRDAALVADLVIARCPVELAMDNANRGASNEGAVASADKTWRQFYDQTIRSPVAPEDPFGGGGSQPVRTTPLTRR
jgi:hypothetical protein